MSNGWQTFLATLVAFVLTFMLLGMAFYMGVEYHREVAPIWVNIRYSDPSIDPDSVDPGHNLLTTVIDTTYQQISRGSVEPFRRRIEIRRCPPERAKFLERMLEKWPKNEK